MKPLKDLQKRNYAGAFLLALLGLFCGNGSGAPVNPAEAIAVADTWYAMELNSGYLKITEAEKTDRFAKMGNCQVLYMVSKDDLADVYPANQTVLAYIVKYEPDGFVVVSGDDRLEPIMVCSAESKFRWDHPERNFLRYYLGKVMPALWNHMPAQIHKNWSLLRGKLSESRTAVTYDDIGRAVYVLWKTAFWDQFGYYNDTCQAHNGGNNVPTGCVATAMAIKMRFHSWPPTGNSAHSYSDTLGSIKYSHNVTYNGQTYNWANMPDTCLTSANSDVARIMYHSGVAVDMNYELEGSGAYTTLVDNALNSYFRYRGTLSIYDDTLMSTHVAGMRTSIIGKLPVQIGGSKHSVVVDGYRDDIGDQWHMNLGWSGFMNGWYRLDSLPWDTTGHGVIDVSIPYGQPNNWIYIDRTWSGAEDGRIYLPFNTLSEGEAASINAGELMIKTGTYTGTGNVPITFDNAVAVRAYAGYVTVGNNLRLTNYEAIKLHGNGQLKITPAKSSK
jgi:hypothetical protein